MVTGVSTRAGTGDPPGAGEQTQGDGLERGPESWGGPRTASGVRASSREEPGKQAVGEEDLRPGVKLLALWLVLRSELLRVFLCYPVEKRKWIIHHRS